MRRVSQLGLGMRNRFGVAALLLTACMAAAPRAAAQYSFSRSVATTSSTSVIPAAQSNYTMTVCFNTAAPCNYGTVAGLNQSGAGAHVQSASGYDIVFGTSASCSTMLSWEVEKYVSSTGELIAHVLLPTLASGSATTIYMCYGNAGISSFQGGAPGAAWDSYYKGIWHLPDGSALSANDSSSNGNNATTVSGAVADAGEVDGAAAFDASGSRYIEITDSSSLDVGATTTWSAWVYINSFPGSSQAYLANLYSDENVTMSSGIWRLGSQGSAALAKRIGLNFNDGSNHDIEGNTDLTSGAWTYLSVTTDGSNVSFYINGSPDVSKAYAITPTAISSAWRLGLAQGSGLSVTRPFDGKMDEIRFSNGIARSANWILTEYNNIASPATFYTVGGETGGAPVHPFDPSVFDSSVFDTGSNGTLYARSGVEGLGLVINERSSIQGSFSRVSAESGLTSERASRVYGVVRSASESGGVGNPAARIESALRAAFDSLAKTDTGSRLSTYGRARAEASSASDFAIRGFQFLRAPFEGGGSGMTSGEIAGRIAAFSRAGVERPSVSDRITRQLGYGRGSQDFSAFAQEQRIRSIGVTRTGSERLPLLDTASRQASTQRQDLTVFAGESAPVRDFGRGFLIRPPKTGEPGGRTNEGTVPNRAIEGTPPAR